MLLKQLMGLLGVNKEIVLSVPSTFPIWHSRYEKDTYFSAKIKGTLLPMKIHALKSRIRFWEKACLKVAKGGYTIRLALEVDRSAGKKYLPIATCKTLHAQRARYDNASQTIVVGGKPVAVETVAGNEGLSCADFMEFLERHGEKDFVIVHFTAFRY